MGRTCQAITNGSAPTMVTLDLKNAFISIVIGPLNSRHMHNQAHNFSLHTCKTAKLSKLSETI